MSNAPIPAAIAYDFDGTLSPGNMQEYDFIPKLDISPKDFWAKAGELAKTHQMDTILAYMWLMIRAADKKDIPVRKSDFHAKCPGKKEELEERFKYFLESLLAASPQERRLRK